MVRLPFIIHIAVAAVAPIDGVSLGQIKDKSTWRIDFKPEATSAQRQAAQGVIVNFDVALEEKKLKDADQAKVDKKASLLSQPNKSVTVQDLLDLGLI
jgi:hypothetical protein